MDVETRIAHYLAGAVGVDAWAVVPEPRPERLVTVERTGGGISNQLDHPTIAVQSWAPTLEGAHGLALEVDAAMRASPFEVPGVFGVEPTTIQRWSDPDSGTPRYQGLYTLTTSP